MWAEAIRSEVLARWVRAARADLYELLDDQLAVAGADLYDPNTLRGWAKAALIIAKIERAALGQTSARWWIDWRDSCGWSPF